MWHMHIYVFKRRGISKYKSRLRTGTESPPPLFKSFALQFKEEKRIKGLI